MKIKLTLLLFLFAFGVNAQKIRFSNHGNRWFTTGHAGVDPECPFHDIVTYGSDTLISGTTYQIVRESKYADTFALGCPYTPGGIYFFDTSYYVREDSTAGMVYFRYPALDTIEHLLYNYNLNLGDSINYDYVGANSFVDSLASVDSIVINGTYHKLFYFVAKYPLGVSYRSYIVLEGIGCLDNPFYPVISGCFEYSEGLSCFSQSGWYPMIPTELDTFELNYYTCWGEYYFRNSCSLSVSEVDATTGNTLFPNPASNHIIVDLGNEVGSNEILVYDLTGKCIYSSNWMGSKMRFEINTTNWIDGLYFVNILIADKVNSQSTSSWKKITISHSH